MGYGNWEEFPTISSLSILYNTFNYLFPHLMLGPLFTQYSQYDKYKPE